MLLSADSGAGPWRHPKGWEPPGTSPFCRSVLLLLAAGKGWDSSTASEGFCPQANTFLHRPGSKRVVLLLLNIWLEEVVSLHPSPTACAC